MNTPISFRLRKDVDADLIEAVEKLDKCALKTLCRDGLRVMLGIRTTKAIEVTERPLNVPQQAIKTAVSEERQSRYEERKEPVRTIPSKPAVFIPQKRR